MPCFNLKCVKLIVIVFAGLILLLFLATSDHYKDTLSDGNIQQIVNLQNNPYLQERKLPIGNGKIITK